MIFQKPEEFRKSIYEHLGTAKDAVFELMDAVLTLLFTASPK
jgi:ABC-type phosphate transport system ATPase subunit